MASSSNEDGNKLHSMINKLETKAQWALSNILRFFIKQLKMTSQHPNTALAEYFKKNPNILENLCKKMMKDNKKLLYEDGSSTICRIIKISSFDVTLLAKLLLNIPDFETCYAISDVKRRAKNCGDLNHAKNKGCCASCDHKGDNGESYCKQCRKSKFLCRDNTYVCCSKCTLCVCCSQNQATPQCSISRLRFAIFLTQLLRNLKSHTSINDWSHISRNEWIPLGFEFCGKTCKQLWEVCKEQVEYLYAFLKLKGCINAEEYDKHIHEIFQFEHLTITEQEGSIAKEIVKKESATFIQKELIIKIAIYFVQKENLSLWGTLNNMFLKETPETLLNKMFSEALDSEFVLKIKHILKKTFTEKNDELSNKAGQPLGKYKVICNDIEKNYDQKNNRDEFHMAVCVKLKSGQNFNHLYASPHSKLSTNFWEAFKDRVTKLALDDLDIIINLTRLSWKVGSILITLKIAKLSGGGFDVPEKKRIGYLIEKLPNQDAFFTNYVITTAIKAGVTPKEAEIILSFSCEVNDDSMYQTMMKIRPAFEKELEKQCRGTFRHSILMKLIQFELVITQQREKVADQTNPSTQTSPSTQKIAKRTEIAAGEAPKLRIRESPPPPYAENDPFGSSSSTFDVSQIEGETTKKMEKELYEIYAELLVESVVDLPKNNTENDQKKSKLNPPVTSGEMSKGMENEVLDMDYTAVDLPRYKEDEQKKSKINPPVTCLDNLEQFMKKILQDKNIQNVKLYSIAEDDAKFTSKIESLYWLTASDIGAKQNSKKQTTRNSITKAMTLLRDFTKEDIQIVKLSFLIEAYNLIRSCVDEEKKKSANSEFWRDVAYVIIKGNAPKWYSHLMNLSLFVTLNKEHLKEQFVEESDLPKSLNCTSFEDMQIALQCFRTATSRIVNLMYDGENGEISFVDEANDLFSKESAMDVFDYLLNGIFEQMTNALIKVNDIRKEICEKYGQDMREIAEKLDSTRKNVLIAKVAGRAGAVAGGIISIVGLALAIPSFGVSAILIPVGVGIGSAGVLTDLGAGIAEWGITKQKAEELKEKRQEYEDAVSELFCTLEELEDLIIKVSNSAEMAALFGKHLVSASSAVVSIVRLAIVSNDIKDAALAAGRAAANAGRGLAIAGLVFSALLLPVDIALFGYGINSLVNKQKSDQAIKIREWLDEDLPSDIDVINDVAKIKDQLSKYIINCHAEGLTEEMIEKEKDEFNNSLMGLLHLKTN